jgi:ATP-binding cassette, subfamily C, bacterial EexD
VFSLFTNVLMLTPMFYMINVFDKAVGTGSFPTLISLAVIAAFLYVVMAFLEWSRSRVLIFVASRLDRVLAPRVYSLCFASESGALNRQGMGVQPLGDLNALRQFLAGGTTLALFDLPWLPLYLIVMVLFHPVLAVVAIICMAIMFVLALANQRATTDGLAAANKMSGAIADQTQRNLRNAEVASAMGMMPALTEKWRSQQDLMLATQEQTSVAASGYSATIKSISTAMQSAAITTGAVLAMQQEISPGVMIGAALLLGRSLSPIQSAVMGWKGLVDAREQYLRLNELLRRFPPSDDRMMLPPISGRLSAKQVVVIPPGSKHPTLTNINFDIPAGATVMVLGASAAGKSTLVRTILGLWPTAQGQMRIDGAESFHYEKAHLGPQIGYLPQDIELFDGTVASNIARFAEVESEVVVQAANDAAVHEMILALPHGYDTVINAHGGLLSPGQRQRIALARALYDRPKLVVLDEPNSNLDEAGELALNSAIKTLKSIGSTVVLVSHRQGAIPLADYLLVMEAGKIKDQGTTADVITRVKQAMAVKQQEAKPVAVGELHAE